MPSRGAVAAISALKTFDPPLARARRRRRSPRPRRHGKFVDLDLGDRVHLVFHLARAGWLRWYDERAEDR